jgi:hypothetical protein
VQYAGQFGNNADIVAILAGAYDDAIELAIPDHGVEGAYKLSAVGFPGCAKGISLRPRVATVVHAEYPGWSIGLQMCTSRARHQPESSDVCKLQSHSTILLVCREHLGSCP